MTNFALGCGFDMNGSNPVATSSTAVASGTVASGATSSAPQDIWSSLGSSLWLLIPLAILIVFWFFSSRSQKKKEKAQAEQRNNIHIGDELVTIGGLVGRVVSAKPDDDKVTIEVGGERNRIVVMKWAIQTIAKKEDVAAVAEKAEAEKKAELPDSKTDKKDKAYKQKD